MNLVLFDIDGTLLKSDGAGRRAMAAAMGALFRRADAFDGLSFAGAVDPAIVSVALRNAGLEPTPRRVGRVRSTYARILARDLPRVVAEGRAALCPGVREAVEAVRARARIGLMTGNWRRGAAIKLGALGLWEPFARAPGGFGDDAHERGELMPHAWRRALRLGDRPRRVVVIGDTPNDVEAARVGAARLGRRVGEVLAVAVNTGFATREALVESRPDLLLEDLESGLGSLLALLNARS